MICEHCKKRNECKVAEAYIAMKDKMKTAANSGLKIMVYTGFPVIEDESIFKECAKKVDTYLKIGPYVEKLPQIEMYGIVLASNNQKIIKY